MADNNKFFIKWLQGQLRRIWYLDPSRNICKIKARVRRGKYRCSICKGEEFGPKQIQIDHIDAVINPETGFRDWNEYIDRLFCPLSGLRVLCKPCHTKVTNEQNKIRRRVKKEISDNK